MAKNLADKLGGQGYAEDGLNKSVNGNRPPVAARPTPPPSPPPKDKDK